MVRKLKCKTHFYNHQCEKTLGISQNTHLGINQQVKEIELGLQRNTLTISHITHEHRYFSEGHKDVTWVLVRPLHGSKLREDPNTALNQTLKVQVITENIDFPLHQMIVYRYRFLLTCNNPRPIDTLSASVTGNSAPLF